MVSKEPDKRNIKTVNVVSNCRSFYRTENF